MYKRQSIYAEKNFLIKILKIYPKSKISLQYHNKRSEHWIVVEGCASVTKDKKTFKLNKDELNNKAYDYLNKVKLKEDLYNKYPSELSGGERQRVVIARALCLKPKLVICDECVSALDKSIQFSILKLLDNLKKEMKLTYIFISHDLALVKIMSDRIIVLKDGQIVDENTTNNLFKNPKKYTKKLIHAII